MKKLFVALAVLASTHATVHAQALDPKDVPAAVKSAAAARNGGKVPPSWVLDKARGYYYGTDASPRLTGYQISLQGAWQQTDTTMELKDLPAPVAKALQAGYLAKGYEGDTYTQVQSASRGTSYLLELSSDDQNLRVTMDAGGKVLSSEKR